MNNKSFTLIEMLVVLVVVGLLIAMAVVGIQAVQVGSREAQRGNDVRNFQGMVEDYYSKFKQYPDRIASSRQMKFDSGTSFDDNGTSGDFTYVCLVPPNTPQAAYNSISCDANASAGGNIYRVYKMGISAKLITGPIAFTSNYFGVAAGTAENYCTTNNVPPSFSTWFLFYSVPNSNNQNPQAYRLGACGEYGLKNPSGSKLD